MSVNFSEEDKLDYLAGIVDTEGTITLHGNSIRLSIANTNKYLIVWLKKEFGANYYLARKKKGYQQAWTWQVSSKHAYKILKKIEGKLILKNERLLLAIEFYERVGKWYYQGRGIKSGWAKKLTEETDAKLHILNERGVDKTGVLRPDSEIKIKNRLVYLAGYCDGDGTIGIVELKKTKPVGYGHSMSTPSTDRRSLEWIQNHYGGTISTVARIEGHAKIYQWGLYGKNAYKLIKELRDHLMLKQEQADAVIKMYEKVTKWNFKWRSSWAVKLQEEMYQKCKELNKTGDNEEETPEEVEIKVVRTNPQKMLAIWT